MKSKYETHVEPRLSEIEAWCRDGISEENIAEKLGVAYSTFRLYKDKHSALSAVVSRTRAYVDDVEVVPAYLRRILGYDVTETKKEYKVIQNRYGEPERTLVSEVETTRHIPGDVRAAEFWLTNRQPEKWKRQPESGEGSSGQEGGIIEIPAITEGGKADG